MKILDRYILRRFLSAVFFALIAFTVIFVVVDLIENLDRFIDHQVPRHVVAAYYLYYLPYIMTLILPVAMLLASLFSIGQMARFNELIAIRSSGVSIYRILAPVFIAAFFVSLADYYFSETVVPITNDHKFQIKRTYLDRVPRSVQIRRANVYIQDTSDRRIFIGFFDPREKTGHNVSIQQYKGSRMVKRWDARRLVWEDSSWVLEAGYLRDFEAKGEQAQPFDSIRFAGLNFRPADLASVQKPPEEMSYRELKLFIREVKRNGGNPRQWLVDLYMKIAFPFSNLIIVMFGAPLASTKRRSGAMVGFGISLAICFLYFGIIRIGQSLGHNGRLAPWLGAWLGNLLFGSVAVYLLYRAER
ncbi:MAG: LPS export ABC transporter permease LptG [Calditrichaeota bacterium]|nr:LPS export ABC transporter permease LptG [Calditrichota bacterium]